MSTETTEDFTAQPSSWDAATVRAGAAPHQHRAPSVIDAFRRQSADRAIARIEECYRRGLAIPDLR